MCGIVGIYSFNNNKEAEKSILAKMTYSLRHRGPDGSGCLLIDSGQEVGEIYRDNDVQSLADSERTSVGLGHRRLSILDLTEAGRQPMSDASERLWIVFNGEIFNYLELEEELISRGYIFKTRTDTEVILQAYLAWGEGCFSRFNGMWSLAIYDQETGELLLTRDRYGKKPLYYFLDDKCLVFGSEPKALFEHPRVVKRPNMRKCAFYAGRHFRYVDADNETFFEGINQVPAGSFWKFTSNGPGIAQKYWSLVPDRNLIISKDENDILLEFKTLLKDAVKIRLRSDVPVGTMLSGGMDSTTITALAAADSDKMHAFSSITGDGYYDESTYIQQVVEYTGVKHSYIYPKPVDLLETLRHMLSYHDEPICTVTWFSLFLTTAEIAKAGIKVVLTGHGGDELLAGYWDHFHYYWHDMRQQGLDPSEEIAAWMENHGRDPQEITREQLYVAENALNREVEIRKFAKYLDALNPALPYYSPTPLIDCPYPGELNRRLYMEQFRESVPVVLRVEDRNMMIHSVENRCPFLDYRLTEFCFALNENLKIRNGVGKYLLREATKGVLPEGVRTRKDKVGHNLPADVWWREEHKETLLQLFKKQGFVNEQLYYLPRVKELFQEHQNGINHYMFFWQYLNLHIWYEQVFETVDDKNTIIF